ncbi:MAG: PIN domain-containing protein [Leptospira sp.]|jgi:predicted nucleic acid-binding protein|nr:PIN domain-containing protein [Leptospira sp.]
MILYIDSSVFLRFLLRHPNSLNIVKEEHEFASSELLKLECQRALIRYRLNQEIYDMGFLELTEACLDLLSRINLLKINSEVMELASRNWGVVLGSLDSIHLASALHIQKEKKTRLKFLTHDKALYTAARISNFEVVGVDSK